MDFLSFAVLCFVNSVAVSPLYRFKSGREKMGGTNELKDPLQEHDASGSLSLRQEGPALLHRRVNFES